MKHLDEGTIHAWLDGQLSDDLAALVERHVADCAECGALVAEARGLVAGASRILSALDDVGGGIVPGSGSANGGSASGGGTTGGGSAGGGATAGAVPPRGRMRWVRPAGWLAAAGVLLAVGVQVVGRDSPPVRTEQATNLAAPRVVSVTPGSTMKAEGRASRKPVPKAATVVASEPAGGGTAAAVTAQPTDRGAAGRAAAYSALEQTSAAQPVCYGAPVAMQRAEARDMAATAATAATAARAEAPAPFALGLMLDTGGLVRVQDSVVGTWSPLPADSVLIRVRAVQRCRG